MMVRLGNFLFRWRNTIFPVFYLLLFLPSPHVVGDHLLAVVIGLVVVVLGQTVRAVTIGLEYVARGGKNQRVYAEDLVTEGIFAHCRNPMYVGNMMVLGGLGLVANSLFFVGIILPLFVLFYMAIVAAEESFLRGKFGEAYEAYTRAVPRWIPRFSGLTATVSAARFQWRRVLRKEYGSTFVWMSGAVLLILRHLYVTLPERRTVFVPLAIGLIALLLVAYLTIRRLKKAKRLEDL